MSSKVHWHEKETLHFGLLWPGSSAVKLGVDAALFN